MRQQGLVPNAITYNTLISAWQAARASLIGDAAARRGARCHHLQCLDQRMRNGQAVSTSLTAFEAMQQQGVVPNAITYNALISACEKGKEP